VAVAAWSAGLDRDGSVNAGTFEWSCLRTADHAVDTVLAPAFFLASRKLDGSPALGGSDFTVGAEATPQDLIEGLATATRILVAVFAAAEPSARAVIRRRPRLEAAGPEEFAPRGGLELILHGHDVCCGPPGWLLAGRHDHASAAVRERGDPAFPDVARARCRARCSDVRRRWMGCLPGGQCREV
jgi:hypothetical protein